MIAVALVDTPRDGFHSKAPPFKTVAIKFSPKLSSDHCLASNVTFDVVDGVPQVPTLQPSVPQPNAEVDSSGPMDI